MCRLSPGATLTTNSSESLDSPSVFFKVNSLFANFRRSFPAILPPKTAYLFLASKVSPDDLIFASIWMNFLFDRLSQRSPLRTNSEDSIHLLEVQVSYCEGEVVLSCSVADLNLDTLARNSVNMNMYVPALVRVDIFSIQLGFSVRLNLHFHVGDCSRDDGLATEGACGSFGGSSPHITCMGTLNHQVTLFFTITVTVYHGVVNSHLEQTITNSCSSIKIKVQIHLIAVCLLENLLQIINFEVNFSSLQWVGSILVLEPHVDSQKV